MDYTPLQEFAEAHKVSYNELCAAVHKAMAPPQAPSTGNALEGVVGGVSFRGRRMFPMDPASPWVVQSIDARGEGPTHQAAVEAWYKDHEAKHPNFAVGHLQYRPRDGEKHRPWAWHYYADGGKWLLADGSSYDAQFYPELAQVLGTVDGLIKLLDMTLGAEWTEAHARANPSRDSLQP